MRVYIFQDWLLIHLQSLLDLHEMRPKAIFLNLVFPKIIRNQRKDYDTDELMMKNVSKHSIQLMHQLDMSDFTCKLFD